MKMMEDMEVGNSSSEEEMIDSDEELQEAFARGDLKPGLIKLESSAGDKNKQKKVINNVPVLEYKLQQIKLPKKLGWVERLDIVNGVAPLAPEIALQMDEHKTKREKEIKSVKSKKKKSPAPALKSIEDDPVHNDFVREMNFYRQAQEAILKCLPRLKELGVPTKRPEDYFAEMAKSDDHMQKVAKVLHKKQIATERAEKVRKIRAQKKFAKQTQVHVLQERQKAKKELLENVKKYRKGQKNNLDFLDEKKNRKPQPGRGKDKPMPNRRRMMKNERYGNGGKKSKWNTRESLDDVGGSGRGGRGGMGNRGPPRGGRDGMGNRGPPGRGRGGMGSRGPPRGGRGGMGNRGPPRGGRSGMGNRGSPGGGRGGMGNRGSPGGRGRMGNARGSGGGPRGGAGGPVNKRPGKSARQKTRARN